MLHLFEPSKKLDAFLCKSQLTLGYIQQRPINEGTDRCIGCCESEGKVAVRTYDLSLKKNLKEHFIINMVDSEFPMETICDRNGMMFSPNVSTMICDVHDRQRQNNTKNKSKDSDREAAAAKESEQ